MFRPSTGNWYILGSKTGQVQVTQFGLTGDIPQPADYDGDDKADLAVFRPSSGIWYFRLSANNAEKSINWGVGTDIPVSSLATFSQ